MEKRKADEDGKEKKLFPIFTKKFKPHVNPLEEIRIELKSSSRNASGCRKPRLLPKKETPGLTQLVLDAGQKRIGPRYCDECGMLYSPGEPEDEELHRQAHLRLENVYSVTMWNNPRILQNFADGGCIVMVQCNIDSKRILNRLRDFLAWLDSELSSSPGSSGEFGSSQRIFIYICPTKRKKVVKILGCAIVEFLDSKKVWYSRLNEEINNSNEKFSAHVGISRLWTDPDFRKKQIATRLCDVIRFQSGIPGYIVPKDKIPILEPSSDGRAFMNKYSNGLGFYYTYKA